MKPNLSQIGMGKEISVSRGVGADVEALCVCMEGERAPLVHILGEGSL